MPAGCPRVRFGLDLWPLPLPGRTLARDSEPFLADRTGPTRRLLLVLCPPRSFSSVICAMLGQHPQLYGFPELNLFVAETVAGLRRFHAANRTWLESASGFPPGLLRALAELLFGGQQPEAIHRACAWLQRRGHWSVGRLLDLLLQRLQPRLGVDKSPVTVLSPQFLERAAVLYPEVRFLHLTRHPVPAYLSLRKQFGARLQRLAPGLEGPASADFFARLWCRPHEEVMHFLDRQPVDRARTVRGEDVLRHPDIHLPRLADWLGLATDSAAIEAMKHPETSPYAHFGPSFARGGHDSKFLANPHLRSVEEIPGLEAVATLGLAPDLHWRMVDLARRFGYG
jgi:hypothetical protein